jgi:hypothetical protein
VVFVIGVLAIFIVATILTQELIMANQQDLQAAIEQLQQQADSLKVSVDAAVVKLGQGVDLTQEVAAIASLSTTLQDATSKLNAAVNPQS